MITFSEARRQIEAKEQESRDLGLEQELKKQFDKVKEVVEHVLATDERARNDDKWMIWKTLKELGFGIWIPFDEFKDMPSFETISRSRRWLQNKQGKYLPTDLEVRKKRGIKKDIYTNINQWEHND